MILACGFLLGTAVTSPAAEVWRYIPDDARWAVAIRMGEYLNSETGKRLTERFYDENAERWNAGVRRHFGMDPMTEIDTVILFGRDARKESGATVVLGDFDPGNALEFISGLGGYRLHEHRSHPLHVWNDGAVAYPRPGMAVVAWQAETVKQVLDVLAGEGGHLSADVFRASGGEGWFLRSFAEDVSSLRGMPPKAAALRYTSRLDLTLGEGEGMLSGTLRLETADEDSAVKLMGMLEAMLFYGPLFRDPDDPLVALAKYTSVSLSDDRTSVALSLAVPLSLLPF